MSTLFLIRHGQASFGAADYDVLSELGGQQAFALGAYWADRDQHLDALYVGPRRRHRASARHFLAGARARARTYPEPQEAPGLDEYPAFELLHHVRQTIADQDPELRAMLAGDPGGPGDARGMERAFLYMVERWARGELDTGGLETVTQFRARVRAAIGEIAAREGRGKTIAAMTSGGPICMAVQWALDLADDVAIRQSWVIGNGSVSEFRYRDPRAITLVGFNDIGHLRAPSLRSPALVTYR